MTELQLQRFRSPSVPALLAALVAVALPVDRAGAQTVFSAAGANAAAIQSTVDGYRAALGAANPNNGQSFQTGRREVNWDGVPDNLSSPNAFPGDFFNVNSPRGSVTTTPGTGQRVSADDNNPAGAPVRFGDINPAYTTQFATFSAQRLFAAVGSNVVDVAFFVPGTTTVGTTRGFGAVFTDVDLANTTSIQYFDAQGGSLGTYFAAAVAGDATLSFLGVLFESSLVSRVRITSGNVALSAGSTGDAVAMDDFIYGEPTSTVPEPATVALLGGGLAALGLGARRRRARA